MTPIVQLLLPALGALLALWGGLADISALFWTGTGLALAALIRRLRAGGSKAALIPGIAILCGGNFVHPWYVGLAAGLCVWAGIETIRVIVTSLRSDDRTG